MDKLAQLNHYWRAYQPTQLRTSQHAREWMEAGVPAETATAWASAGFLPEEGAPLIASGMTLEMATAADPQTSQKRMEYLADRIQMLD